MISFRRLASGVLLGWVATFASIAVGFFMSPFLIHHLGVAGYGVWVLVQSAVSYMFIMDLGLRQAVVRFVSRAQARDDHAEISRVASAALWIRLWSAAAVIALIIGAAALLPLVLKIPPQYQAAARVALLLVGGTFALTLVFSVFSALLVAIGRYEVLGFLELGQISATALGLIPIIKAGHGIIAMAVWQFAVILAVNLATAALCFRIYPQLRCSPKRPGPDLLRSLWNVGAWVLVFNIAGQLIVYTDNLVVGAFVSAAAVSYYAVAAKMVEYLRSIAIAILRYFAPLASSYEARNRYDRLEQLSVRGTQAVLLVTYPPLIALLFRGGTFLRLWIGVDFADKAAPVLRILSIGAAIMLANCSLSGLLLALDRQRTLAIVTATEGLFNLGLSLFLARRMGIMGVAIGTVIPAMLSGLLFWPRYICRLLNMSLIRYIREAWLRPILAVLPFALACYIADQRWSPTTLLRFFAEMAMLAPIAVLGAILIFWSDVPTVWHYAFKRRQLETAQ